MKTKKPKNITLLYIDPYYSRIKKEKFSTKKDALNFLKENVLEGERICYCIIEGSEDIQILEIDNT